jgi:hypothetical protein
MNGIQYDTNSYAQLYTGKKKGSIPLELSLFILRLGIFCHVLLGIWWRWRQLNSNPNIFILKLFY